MNRGLPARRGYAAAAQGLLDLGNLGPVGGGLGLGYGVVLGNIGFGGRQLGLQELDGGGDVVQLLGVGGVGGYEVTHAVGLPAVDLYLLLDVGGLGLHVPAAAQGRCDSGLQLTLLEVELEGIH